MLNYIELKADIRQHGRVVTCEILEMDERLRDRWLLYDKDGFTIKSHLAPIIEEEGLWLKGTRTDLDDQVGYIVFGTSEEAAKYISKLSFHIKQFNGFQGAMLAKEELEFLQSLIDILPAKIKGICKTSYCSVPDFEYLLLSYYSIDGSADKGKNAISLPLFEKGERYKNMSSEVYYTLEELGLTPKKL